MVKLKKRQRYHGIWVLIVLLGFLIGCISPQEPTPTRGFTTRDLLIDLSDMPSGWTAGVDLSMPISEGGSDDSVIMFKILSPVLYVAGHWVWHYSNPTRAAINYEKKLVGDFNSNSMAALTPWEVPDGWSYQSLLADQFHFACYETEINVRRTICQSMGQYEEYLVIFHSAMSPQFMTYEDFEHILGIIDERMAYYLKGETLLE